VNSQFNHSLTMLGQNYTMTDDPTDSVIVDEPASPSRGIESFIGRRGVDLDGESLLLPADGDFADEISSINTSNYGASSPGRRNFGDRFSIHGNTAPTSVAVGVLALDTTRGEDDGLYKDNDTLPESPDLDSPSCRDFDDDDNSGFLPSFLSDAPCWLKTVIVISTAMLVGAIVLVGVVFALAHFDGQSIPTPFTSSVTSVAQPSVSPAASPSFGNIPGNRLPTLAPHGPTALRTTEPR
jgi:hypothetical protein